MAVSDGQPPLSALLQTVERVPLGRPLIVLRVATRPTIRRFFLKIQLVL